MTQNKPRLGVTVDQELIDWIDLMIEKRVFANRSHGVEVCIQWAKDGFNRGELPPR
ncbi:ribbon-helix-helix domain-containing protein [Methanomassiliicoccaceae archaeon COG_1]|nr:ribbon-helix-helix domain-containing protein [Methanomassiliicoccaceae archaeon COG_1]